jgi:hypothetical protein
MPSVIKTNHYGRMTTTAMHWALRELRGVPDAKTRLLRGETISHGSYAYKVYSSTPKV